MSNDTPDDAKPLSPDALIAALEAEVLSLRGGEAEAARERAAIVLERARSDEERARSDEERVAWEAVRRGLEHTCASLEHTCASLEQRCVSLEQRCASLEHERDELGADRDAVLGRLAEVTEVLARREAEWNAASAGMDEERARWVSEEAEYARLRDEDLTQLQRARRFSPRHRVGVLVHRLKGGAQNGS